LIIGLAYSLKLADCILITQADENMVAIPENRSCHTLDQPVIFIRRIVLPLTLHVASVNFEFVEEELPFVGILGSFLTQAAQQA